MKKKIIMAAISAAGFAAAAYFFLTRKKTNENSEGNAGKLTGNKNHKHLTDVFSKAKAFSYHS